MKAYLVVLLCISLTMVDARLKGKNDGGDFLCSKTMPCGWEVYEQYKRTPQYFVKSPCECPAGKKCVQSSDDISISAYVYRCAAES